MSTQAAVQGMLANATEATQSSVVTGRLAVRAAGTMLALGFVVAPPAMADTISTFAGNGTPGYSGDGLATSANLNYPAGVAFDLSGNLYIADQYNNRVRKVDSFGTITTVAGDGTYIYSSDGGQATNTGLRPRGVTVDSNGNLYIADSDHNRIRKVDTNGIITTVAGTLTASSLPSRAMARMDITAMAAKRRARN
jgi:DNA-binding beta-propeller fold protein YncE